MKFILLLLTLDQILGRNITVAFGSCFKFYRSMKSEVFLNIATHNPDLFAWLGDAAYVDKMVFPGIFEPELDPQAFEFKLNVTKYDPDYMAFRLSHRVIGVYDDHDFGLNNADRNKPNRELSAEKYLDFLDISPQDPLRRQGAIYQSYWLNEFVKIILLDVRYEKDPLSFDMLGTLQWVWLENELSDDKAELVLLGSGIQFFVDDRIIPESWYQDSKLRLFQMISKYDRAVLFISGDVHMAEILHLPCSKQKYGKQFVEVTSSGLNFANGDQYFQFDFLSNLIFPDTFNSKKERFTQTNYGIIRVELDEYDHPQILLIEIYHSHSNQLKLQKIMHINEFKANNSLILDQPCILDIPINERWMNNIIMKAFEFWQEMLFIFQGVLLLYMVTIYLAVKWLKRVYKIYHNKLD